MGQCHFGEGPETDRTMYDNLEMVVNVVGTGTLDMHCRVKSGKERGDPMTRAAPGTQTQLWWGSESQRLH